MDIVLVNPEIPQNTGSIARTCAATCTPLCIIGTPAFEISDKRARRAGLDYWPYVSLFQFEHWEQYQATRLPRTIWAFTKFGSKQYHEVSFADNDALVFGSETSGLPNEILDAIPLANHLYIPMACTAVRSLNLSNAVSIALYEARRQLGLDQEVPVRDRPT